MRRFLKKISFALILAVVLSVFSVCFAACNGKKDNEIILWWPSGRAYQSMLDEALTRFKAEHQDVNIKVQYRKYV